MADSGKRASRITIGLCALVCALVAIIISVAVPMLGVGRMKIGYVRTTELVYGFAGMKEAHQVYEKKRLGWQGLLDSLEADYQKSLGAYNAERASLSASAQKEREAFIEKQRQNVQQQREELEGRIRDEDQRMTHGVLSQINSLAEQYGKEHGFDLILSTTQSGSILYGNDAIDITKPLLEVLNRNYNPGVVPDDSTHDRPAK